MSSVGDIVNIEATDDPERNVKLGEIRQWQRSMRHRWAAVWVLTILFSAFAIYRVEDGRSADAERAAQVASDACREINSLRDYGLDANECSRIRLVALGKSGSLSPHVVADQIELLDEQDAKLRTLGCIPGKGETETSKVLNP